LIQNFLGNRKLFIQLVVSLLFIALTFNCNKTTVIFHKQEQNQNLQEYSIKTYSYFAGYQEFGVTKFTNCEENKISNISMERNWLDGLIHIAIGGFVTTRSTTITCLK